MRVKVNSEMPPGLQGRPDEVASEARSWVGPREEVKCWESESGCESQHFRLTMLTLPCLSKPHSSSAKWGCV